MPELQLRGGALDGVDIHYVVEGHGPAVVLVHGLGGFAEAWRHNVAYLRRQVTVCAIDLPGFGLSTKPHGRYDLRLFVEAIRWFTSTLGLDRFSLVGHSLGGAIAMAYAVYYPASVERVAVLGAVIPGFGYRLAPAYRLLTVPALGDAIAACLPKAAYRRLLARCFVVSRADEVAFLVDWNYRTRTGPEGRAAYLATLRGVRADFVENDEAYHAAMARLTIPVLAIHGVQDPVVPAAHCARVIDRLRHGAVRWLDPCGHFPQIEHADTVNAWLAEFLVGRTAPR